MEALENLSDDMLANLEIADDISEDSPTVSGIIHKRRRAVSKKNDTEFITLVGIQWEKHGLCAFPGCNAECAQRCKNCPWTFYCSREHQTQDWSSHKPNCELVSWKETEDEDSDDYFEARVEKTLRPGKELFSKKVLFSCPRYPTPEEMLDLQRMPGLGRPRPCMECQRLIIILPEMGIYAEQGACKDCGWPLHGTCFNGPEHRAECKVLRENNVTWSPEREHLLTLGGILRGYLLKESKPEIWSQIMALVKRSPLNTGFLPLMGLAKEFLQDDCHMQINEPELYKFMQVLLQQRINCGAPFSELKRYTTVICQGGLPFPHACDEEMVINIKGEVFMQSMQMRMRFVTTKGVPKNAVLRIGNGGGILST